MSRMNINRTIIWPVEVPEHFSLRDFLYSNAVRVGRFAFYFTRILPVRKLQSFIRT